MNKSSMQSVFNALTMMIALSGCKISQNNIDSSEFKSTDAVDGARNCLDEKNPAIKGFYFQDNGNIIPFCGTKDWKKLGIVVHNAKSNSVSEGGVFDPKTIIECPVNMILVSANITNNTLEGQCASLKGTTYGVKEELRNTDFPKENIGGQTKLRRQECPANQYVRKVMKGTRPGDVLIFCSSIVKHEY